MTTVAEQRAEIARVVAKINKGSKVPLITTVDNTPNPYQLRYPCGVTQLDIDTGGGLPACGITYISGPDGAGKTWLLHNYFRMNQLIYGEKSSILYLPTEFLPDYYQMRRTGVQVPIPTTMLDEADVTRAKRGLPLLTKAERASLQTKVGNFVIGRAPTAEEVLDLIVDAYASGAFHIIALDSVSILQAKAEASLESLEKDPQQAANSRLLTRFLQRLHPLCIGLTDKPIRTSLIFTAQVRANRQKSEAVSYMQKYLKDWATGGANAAKHGKLIDINVWSGASEKEGGKDGRVAVGKEIKWQLAKGKAGTHDGITGSYDYKFSSPGDHLQDFITTGMRHGVIKESAGKLTFLHSTFRTPLVVDGNTMENIEGVQGLRNLLQTQPQLELCLRREVYAAAGLENIYLGD